MNTQELTSFDQIRNRILEIRGSKVLLDQDLAELYGVDTKQLTRQVRRNPGRFPPDFAVQLSMSEFETLRQGTHSPGRGGRRYRPWVFTEQGVAMLSSVLRSEQAIEANVQIMRAFVQLRELISSHHQLRDKLLALERRLTQHDAHFRTVFDAIRQLMAPPLRNSVRRIGFVKHEESERE